VRCKQRTDDMNTTIDTLNYEDASAQLDKILVKLESGDLPLEEALALYEQGAALAAHCARQLDEAELRVRLWQNGNQTAPLEGWREN
jgi:exodeoxyribonuclease VII small subunit